MEFIKLYTTFRDDPKVLGLSDPAFRLHVETLLWVGEHETDGLILGRFDQTFVEELCRAGLWDRAEDGLRIHAWERWNSTHSEMEARRNAGRNAARSRWRNANGNAKRIAKGNTEEEVEEEEEIDTRPDWHPDSRPLAEHLRDLLLAEGAKVPKTLDRWTREAHLLLDVDKRDPAEAKEVIAWARADEFWSGNVFSMAAVRRQYDKLKVQRDRSLKKQRVDEAKAALPDLREEDW